MGWDRVRRSAGRRYFKALGDAVNNCGSCIGDLCFAVHGLDSGEGYALDEVVPVSRYYAEFQEFFNDVMERSEWSLCIFCTSRKPRARVFRH